MSIIDWKSWEGTHAVPNLHLEKCPWCGREQSNYFLVAYEVDSKIDTELVCDACSGAAPDFITMRKDGLSRKLILQDFGFRSRDGRTAATGLGSEKPAAMLLSKDEPT